MNSQNEICEEYYAQLNQQQLDQPLKHSEQFERSCGLLLGSLIAAIALLLASVLFASNPLKTSHHSQPGSDPKALWDSREFIQQGRLKTVSYDSPILNAANRDQLSTGKQQRVWM